MEGFSIGCPPNSHAPVLFCLVSVCLAHGEHLDPILPYFHGTILEGALQPSMEKQTGTLESPDKKSLCCCARACAGGSWSDCIREETSNEGYVGILGPFRGKGGIMRL